MDGGADVPTALPHALMSTPTVPVFSALVLAGLSSPDWGADPATFIAGASSSCPTVLVYLALRHTDTYINCLELCIEGEKDGEEEQEAEATQLHVAG